VELWYVVAIDAGSVPAGQLDVQMRKAGGSWTTIKSHPLISAPNGFNAFTIMVNQYAGYEAEVQFLITGVNLGAEILIDQVELGIEPLAPTTTTTKPTITTTTKPATTTTTTTRPPTTTSAIAATTTTRPPETTTTTLVESTTSTTDGEDSRLAALPPGSPQPPAGQDPSSGSGFPRMSDADMAKVSGIAMNMAPAGEMTYDRMLGLSPLTSLTASFRSVVEAIQSEFLSALGLAFLVAFFAVRIPGNEDEIPEPAA
jgi:alternate signal-mediated exported protein